LKASFERIIKGIAGLFKLDDLNDFEECSKEFIIG
jgi:hypothetical protein